MNCKHSPDKVFQSLEGQWRLERTVSTGDRFSGSAIFYNESPEVLRLEEAGELFLKDRSPIASSQIWFWKILPEKGIDIYFDPELERLYHALEMRAISAGFSAEGRHQCGNDQYNGHYQFEADRFTVSQSVRGPNKNYDLVSVFTR